MYDKAILIHFFYTELNKNMTDDLVIHVVGNKMDLESQRQVYFSSVCNRLTNSVNGVHEVSAKTGQGTQCICYSYTNCSPSTCRHR